MSKRIRSASVGAAPCVKPLARSRVESSQPALLEVRCACQYFQSDSLIPERINPVGTSRPTSPAGFYTSTISTNGSRQDILNSHPELEEKKEDLSGSILSVEVIGQDYYSSFSAVPTSQQEISQPAIIPIDQTSLISDFHPPTLRSTVSIAVIPSTPTIVVNRAYIQTNMQETMDRPSRPLQQTQHKFNKPEFCSQRSLDRYSTSTLLQRYKPKSASQAPSLQGSTVDVQTAPRIQKTVSFDYGKPTHRMVPQINPNQSSQAINNNYGSANYMEDQYHPMSPVAFPVLERIHKIERMSEARDHEYEPIGEPLEDEPTEDQTIEDPENINAGTGMQLLRTPTQDSEDNISAQDFQDDIENRFFSNTMNVSTVSNVVPTHIEVPVLHRENISQEAVIIDNASVHEDSPSKKRNLISSAQEQSKNFRKKIRTQASLIKTSINNKIKKKPKEKPVAVEVAHLPVDASQAIEVQPITQSSNSSDSPAPAVLITRRSTSPRQSPNKFARKGIRMPKMSRPEFTKKINAPTMPKMPKFKKMSMPDRPKMPDMPKFGMQDKFASFRQLGRSKSLKETSVTTTDSTSFTTPELSTTAQPSKKKFEFDFRTYPRLLKDKFKKQKMERSDRSVRADTPPVLEFTTVSKSAVQKNRGPVASRWIDEEEESGKYRQFGSDLDRESSVERRMRMDFEGAMDEDDAIELARRLLNEEQKQLDELDRENQEIHAGAKQSEHKQRKVVPRQESDDDHFWSGTLNKDVKDEYEIDEQQLAEFASHDENYRFSLEEIDQKGFRSSTPQTNQETQSSGSSGARRRTALLDEIDDEFFLQRRDNNDNMQMGEYISEAIKEGLSSPVNALAQMGRYDNYYEREYTPEKPTRSLRRNNKKDSQEPEDRGSYQDEEEIETKTNFYRTYPPDRPNRKSNRKGYHEDEDDFSQEVPYMEDYLVDEVNNNQHFFEKNPDVTLTSEDIENEMDLKFQSKLPVPPTPPRRRKKRVRDITPANGVPFEEMPIELIREAEKLAKVPQAHDVIVHRVEHDIPLAEEERFTTPTPVPRRTRSRSRLSARTSGDADSLRIDSNEMLHFHRMNVDAEGTNGYAVIKKDAPPRPPAPLRRKRSTKSLGDRQFATLPHFKGDESPIRPTRNYSTITPNRPPRRKSSCSLENEPLERSQVDDDEYEEIETNLDAHDPNRRLKSGDVISKMKDRPLPPPPRPKRDPKKHRKSESDGKHDKDDDAEKIQIVPVRQESSDLEVEERVIEVDMSTQTDPVPEDYECEFDEDIDLEQYIRDGKLKSLEEILKEEQEAEIERHRQLAEAENLSRGIQRFRESSQRSFSEKSGRSDRPKTPISRPLTPSAILVERKKSSPIMFNNENEMVTEAVLFVHPIQMEERIQEQEIRQEEIALQNALRIEREEILEREAERILIQELEAEKIQNIEKVTRKISYDTTDEDKLQNVEPEAVKLQNIEDEILRNIESEIEVHQTPTVKEPEPVKLLNTDSQVAFTMPETSVPLTQDYQNFPPEVTFEEIAVDRLESDIIRQIDEMVEKIVSTAEDQAQDIRGSNTQINFEDLLEDHPLPTPIAPPRKKSTPLDTLEMEALSASLNADQINRTNVEEFEQNLSDDEPRMERDTEETEKQSNLPASRLHISSLEIDMLSVSSLTAGRITVSELDSHSITANEFECKSDSRTLTIPPGLIDEIVERVRSSERESRQLEQQLQEQTDAQKAEQTKESNESKEEAPARPPPPQIPPFVYGEYQGYSMVPPSFYQLRNYSDEELAAPQTPHRRRRHVRRRDSTSEEEFQREQKVRSRQGTRSPEPSVSASGGQFARACGSALQRSGSNLMAILRAASKDENRRDLHIALLILVVIVAGLMMFGVGDTAVHHHHWDYFNPPDNPGRS